MRAAVISDIHGNLPALEAVLAEIARHEHDEIWCLGDIVGYGAEPDACVASVREAANVCLVGNHDLAVLGELDTATFSSAAATAVNWTRANSSQESLAFLAELAPAETGRDAALYHASPRDPIWEYVLWPDQAAECLIAQEARVSLVGHSHIALFFSLAEQEPGVGPEARGWQAGAGTQLEIETGRWLINPGSVGQPRDGDPRAAWLELDTDSWAAAFHRVTYDIDRAAEAIIASGLPPHLGKRLFAGQ